MASALSYHDKKIICEASDFIKKEEKSVTKSIEEFKDKGYFGLWMDAKGFWEVTDQKIVLESMKAYNEINANMLACIQSVENDEGNAYLKIIDLYEKLEELERDADTHASGNSKALCSIAKNFLDTHWRLDHNLKRVECIVLVRDLNKTKKVADDLSGKLDEAITSFNTIRGDNLNLKQSLERVIEKNDDLETSMEKFRKENADLKKMISESNEKAEQRFKEANERADQRLSEANKKADQRLKEMVEETTRNMQKMMMEMQKSGTK